VRVKEEVVGQKGLPLRKWLIRVHPQGFNGGTGPPLEVGLFLIAMELNGMKHEVFDV
jgi:hypothetical protein